LEKKEGDPDFCSRISFGITIFVNNSSEQERGISPSLPDTSTFRVNSPQMAQTTAPDKGKTQNEPKSREISHVDKPNKRN